jgi:hypothetical protein
VFRFAGHIMPTLNSQVAFTVTAPNGVPRVGGGQANIIGYYYDPNDDFVLDQPGLWSVDVRVWHDGLCSGGQTAPPFPQGDVLGSADGRYWIYVVEPDAPRLNVSAPQPGFLSFYGGMHPITVTGNLPPGLTNAAIDYTIHMPGFLLEHGQVVPDGNIYQVVFDPQILAQDFPNLDLSGRDDLRPGLADTISISLLLHGQRGGEAINQANVVILQGDQVFVEAGETPPSGNWIFLPLILRVR